MKRDEPRLKKKTKCLKSEYQEKKWQMKRTVWLKEISCSTQFCSKIPKNKIPSIYTGRKSLEQIAFSVEIPFGGGRARDFRKRLLGNLTYPCDVRLTLQLLVGGE